MIPTAPADTRKSQAHPGSGGSWLAVATLLAAGQFLDETANLLDQTNQVAVLRATHHAFQLAQRTLDAGDGLLVILIALRAHSSALDQRGDKLDTRLDDVAIRPATGRLPLKAHHRLADLLQLGTKTLYIPFAHRLRRLAHRLFGYVLRLLWFAHRLWRRRSAPGLAGVPTASFGQTRTHQTCRHHRTTQFPRPSSEVALHKLLPT